MGVVKTDASPHLAPDWQLPHGLAGGHTLQQRVLDDASRGSLGNALGTLANSDRLACDIAGHQRRQQRQQPQMRSQHRRRGPQPRSSCRRSPMTGEKQRATSAMSSTSSAAMTRRRWRSLRPRTGRPPSCRTASRERPAPLMLQCRSLPAWGQQGLACVNTAFQTSCNSDSTSLTGL